MQDISNKISLNQLLDLVKEYNYDTKYYLLGCSKMQLMYYYFK